MAQAKNVATHVPRMPGIVCLPTGQQLTEAAAREAGFRVMSKEQADAEQYTDARVAAMSRVAIRVPGMMNRVQFPGGKMVREEDARAEGWRVMTRDEADAYAAQAVKDAQVDAFTALPEAKGKVRSAMRLAADNPAMTPDQARGFLRGAPTDAAISAQRRAPAPTAPTTQRTEEMSSNTTDEAARRAARRAELSRTMQAVQGRRVTARQPVDEPAPQPVPVDKEARKAELRAVAKAHMGRR